MDKTGAKPLEKMKFYLFCLHTSNDFLLNHKFSLTLSKYSLQGTTQGRYLTGGVPPVRFSM